MFRTTSRLSNSGGSTPHVAYVVKRYPRFSETFVVNEILAHEQAGLDISIFALRPSSDAHFQPALARVRAAVTYLPSAGIRVNDFWTSLQPHLDGERLPALAGAADCDGMEVFQALQLAAALRDGGVDHIHAHFATSAATVARLASRLTGIPYSLTAHAKDIYHEYVNPSALGQKLSDAESVITVSDYNKQHLEREYPDSAHKTHRIYNGLPLDDFPFAPAAVRPPLILGVGRLVEKKGFSDLLAACSILSQLDVEYRCELIGGGDLEAPLRRQIETLGLESRVRLLGPLPSDQVVAALQRAAVLAAPCVTALTGDRDGLPTVLLEAMALGTPCVATAVTGIPEIVQDRTTGLLVPERDPERLAGALCRLLKDRDLAQQLAARGRALIEQEFDIHRNTARLRELFLHGRYSRTRTTQLAEAV
jgi:colanic acid/amylovoran biosynthesis glycosyltransferase